MVKAFKVIPKNYLADWGEFESWSLGTGSCPDGWLGATSPTCAQESSDVKFGDYSLNLTGGASQGGVYRTVPNGADYAGRTFTFGCWAKSSSTAPFIKISDGVSSATVHLDGLNAMAEFTTPAFSTDNSATELRVDLICPAGVNAVFDSAVLVEGGDWFTIFDDKAVFDEWRPSTSMRQDEHEVAGRDGSIINDSRLQSKKIRASGTVIGSDVRSARTHFDNTFKSMLSWQTNQEQHFYLYEDRVMEVFLRSFDWQYINAMQYIRFNLNLTNPRSTTRSINRYRHRQVIAGSITEFNLSYGGNHAERPIISFIADQGGAITTCSLKNLTNNEALSYTGTVPTGVALNIDCDNGTVQNSSVNKIADFTGDFIPLVRGTNYFRFSGSNCTIHIDWFERFL